MSRACADHPPLTQFSPPASLQISPRLSPQPPTSRKKKKKNHPKITSRPQRGPCQTFAFIAARTGGKSADGWQLFEGVEGGGCEGGQCHTKGGQEGKISHPWSVRQRSLFFFGGGGGIFSGAVNKYPYAPNTTQRNVVFLPYHAAPVTVNIIQIRKNMLIRRVTSKCVLIQLLITCYKNV